MAQKDPATIIRVTAQLVPKELQVSAEKENGNAFLQCLEIITARGTEARKLREQRRVSHKSSEDS